MNSFEDLISMTIQVEEKPDLIIINYTVNNASDQDIYLTDVLIGYQKGKPEVDLKDIHCGWLKPKGYLFFSNFCEPIPEGMLLMTEPSYYVTKITANSKYSNKIILKTPVLVTDFPSIFFQSRVAKKIKLEFGYSFYNKSLNLIAAKELGTSIFIADDSFLNTQKILSAELRGLSIPCKKR